MKDSPTLRVAASTLTSAASRPAEFFFCSVSTTASRPRHTPRQRVPSTPLLVAVARPTVPIPNARLGISSKTHTCPGSQTEPVATVYAPSSLPRPSRRSLGRHSCTQCRPLFSRRRFRDPQYSPAESSRPWACSLGSHRLHNHTRTLDHSSRQQTPQAPVLLNPSLAPLTHSPRGRIEHFSTGPQIEALLLNTFAERWEPPRKPLRKMPKSSSLSLAMRPKSGKENANSPISPLSPASPHTHNGEGFDIVTPTAPVNETLQSPVSPKPRKDSKNIFSNFGATKSTSRLANPDKPTRHNTDQGVHSTFYNDSRGAGSTPDLSRPIHTPNSDDNRPEHAQRNGSNKSEASEDWSSETAKRAGSQAKKQGGLLSRNKSIKMDEGGRAKSNKVQPSPLSPEVAVTWVDNGHTAPLKTAPLEKDKSWRQNIAFGKLRTHSADRHDGSLHTHRVDDDASSRKDKMEQSSVAPGSYSESRGAQLMSNLGFGARKMGEKFDSARKGMFGKLGRSSSNHERELQMPKEPYQFKIIHTPLVEQTRLTRISSRLENSKDKTEFWMPALPWRCIDYLNMKGCEEEGLYRVPGAAHQVRYYEQKFDRDLDIDLIADDNLNDPNVVGSLFKNWLRQLPDEIFPKAIQSRIQQECQGAKTTPKQLKDALSRLPPFNYYLLFAITCHISLLHSCSEFNKMNYNNLCICFQPAIKIDAFCFYFLILDWRNCWQGCWTEKEYLAEEVKLLEEAREAQSKPQPAPCRNGHHSSKSKGSQNSGYLGDSSKPSSARADSMDRAKPASTRGLSSDRNTASGRATPPNAFAFGSDNPGNSKRGATSQRDPSADSALSSSDIREAFNARGTPLAIKRQPAVMNANMVDDDEEGDSATPTQAQHNRGASESQFRLDLNNPPSSPFSVKF